MIDWMRVEELRGEVGEDAFVEVTEMFLEEVEEAIVRLKADTSRTNLADELHFLKGSALSLGFENFATLCQDDEKRLLAQGVGAVDLVALIDCYSRSKGKFLEGLERYRPAA